MKATTIRTGLVGTPANFFLSFGAYIPRRIRREALRCRGITVRFWNQTHTHGQLLECSGTVFGATQVQYRDNCRQNTRLLLMGWIFDRVTFMPLHLRIRWDAMPISLKTHRLGLQCLLFRNDRPFRPIEADLFQKPLGFIDIATWLKVSNGLPRKRWISIRLSGNTIEPYCLFLVCISFIMIDCV